jgi:hypothetical protein
MKETFMKNYFSFSQALEELKKGNSVQRKHWKGKGNYVYIEKGCTSKSNKYREMNGVSKVFFDTYDGEIITRMPNLCFRDTTGNLNNGWQPNANDMLSEDWCIFNS